MTDDTVGNQSKSSSITVVDLDRKLDAVGWGLFFVWIGVALLLEVGWGIGLLGVGIITLGGQAGRRCLGDGGDPILHGAIPPDIGRSGRSRIGLQEETQLRAV